MPATGAIKQPSNDANVRLAWPTRAAGAVLLAVAVTLVHPVATSAATPTIGLGAASSFAVLAGSGITNTGPSTVTGDIGTFPTPAETGFGTLTLNGTNHGADAVTQQAKTDLTTAYNQAAGSGPATAIPTELGGTTVTPGVYNSPTLAITGTLTLNALGDPSAVFVFQASSTLITAAASSVVVLNGGTACNVFWQVGSSATLGTGSSLIGSVLAATSITANTGARVQGRLLASNGAVTLDTNTITRPSCPSSAPVTAVPGTVASLIVPPSTVATPAATSAPTTSATVTVPTPTTSIAIPATTTAVPATTTAPIPTIAAAVPSPVVPSRTDIPLALTGSDWRAGVLGLVLVAGGAILVIAAHSRRESRTNSGGS